MPFDPSRYGPAVAELLALDGNGLRLMPLAGGTCSSPRASQKLKTAVASTLFPNSVSGEAAMSGLWLYFSCLEEAHQVAQRRETPDLNFWHGIMHRQEPDAGNAAYWFRRVGRHPIFPALGEAAAGIMRTHPEAKFEIRGQWDPFAFIDFCERARRNPGGPEERAALEIQRAEWQLLFDYCARAREEKA